MLDSITRTVLMSRPIAVLPASATVQGPRQVGIVESFTVTAR